MVAMRDAHTGRAAGAAALSFTLPEELLLMVLNEESGYFYQVPGWSMNCALVGAAIAELSFIGRIDSDMDSLILLDATETGNPNLDPILREIAAESQQHDVRYWIERLAPLAETIVHQTLDRLVERGVLEHHPGEFWTISQFALHSAVERDGERVEFVKTRVRQIIFAEQLPDPRDVIIITLAQTCDVLRFVYELNEPFVERVEWICRMDLIGQAIGAAVSESIAAPVLRHAPLTKPIPKAPLRDLIFNRHLRQGNLPALFASLAEKHGPVFELRPPFRDPMIFLVSAEANRWVHREGRLYLRSKEYFQDVDKAYGVSRSIHSTDGADHFSFRKAMQPVYARSTVTQRLDDIYELARGHMATWTVGDSMPAQTMLRPYMNAQASQLLASIDTQDVIDEALKYKERVLSVALMKVLPKFMMHTPTMRRRTRLIRQIIERMQLTHSPAQRSGKPLDVVDGYLALHGTDPQFLPETDLALPLGAMLMTAMYLGDQLGFALYWMVANPDLHERVAAEADGLFANGDPSEADLTLENIDVTHRLLMETLRLTPIAPVAMRTVMNTCVVEGHELPVGSLLYIPNTAVHYMESEFPDPWKFDIDRYLPPRNEHVGGAYSPYGLGTHSCLGFRWSELHLALNLLMLAHYFRFELARPYKRLPMDPLPSQSPSNKLKFRIAEQRHELSR